MLRRGDVLGLEVITLDDGRQVGVVEEVAVDREAGVVKGLIVRAPVGQRQTFIPFGEVHAFGQDAVTLANGCRPRPLAAETQLDSLADLLGKPVLSSAGVDLGTIDDLCFDEHTGAILGYQVSGGLLQDLLEGKELLPFSSRLIYGEDAVIVRDLE